MRRALLRHGSRPCLLPTLRVGVARFWLGMAHATRGFVAVPSPRPFGTESGIRTAFQPTNLCCRNGPRPAGLVERKAPARLTTLHQCNLIAREPPSPIRCGFDGLPCLRCLRTHSGCRIAVYASASASASFRWDPFAGWIRRQSNAGDYWKGRRSQAQQDPVSQSYLPLRRDPSGRAWTLVCSRWLLSRMSKDVPPPATLGLQAFCTAHVRLFLCNTGLFQRPFLA
jgi:hypothetical protein